MARRTLLWLPAIVYMAVIFVLSAQSNPLPEVTTRVWDKLLHFLEYGGLALLFARALVGEGLPWRATLALAIVLTSAYGATDEFHQSFVLGRDSTLLDWTADSLGALVGAWAYVAVRRRGSAGSHQAPVTSHQPPATSKV